MGMPTWQVSEPYISLWLQDEPLGYQPAIGPRISFKLRYKQSETGSGFNPNIFSTGKKWYCSWLSYLTQDGSGNTNVYFTDGGVQVFNNTTNYLTNTRLTGNPSAGFTLLHPDGSGEVYGFIVTNSDGSFQSAFMTQKINAHGQYTTFNYFPYIPGSSPVIRLVSVVDGDGRTNLVFYNSTSAFGTNLISAVVDGFGRTNLLAYDNNGQLTNSIDTAGLSSSFGYDANGLVTNLTTPYGTTSFVISNGASSGPPNGRSILVGRPDGSHELYLYQDSAAGAASSLTPPGTSPFGNTFNTTDLDSRNSYYWGPRQYEALSSTNIGVFTAADFLKARWKHWLLDGTGAIGSTLSIERDSSPDSAGSIAGQMTWYDYAGKTNSEYEGNQINPLFVAKTLPDTSTYFVRTERNSFGQVTAVTSTYAGGLRANTFGYSADGIDLIVETNGLGVMVSSNAYNYNHDVVFHFNALNELTSYTYNANEQVTSITLPTGLVATNIYDANGFLSQHIVIGFSTNSYTYTNDLIYTHTDERGLTTTSTWDNLNRLTSVSYPDGSCVSNVYTRLDLTGTQDRMGYWTYYGYDALRRRTAVTNALGNVTLYNYCTCGSLESVLDAGGNLTQYSYDNQGNLINTVLTNTATADGFATYKTYNLLRQVVTAGDSTGSWVTNYYNNQGLITSVQNAFGTVASYTYDILDRVTGSVDANGVSISTAYDQLNRPLTRSYPDSGVEKLGYTFGYSGVAGFTNQIGNVTIYGYDAMNRKTFERFMGGTTNQFIYDGAGDLLALTDGKNQTTTWHYDSFGRVTNKVDAAGVVNFVYQ